LEFPQIQNLHQKLSKSDMETLSAPRAVMDQLVMLVCAWYGSVKMSRQKGKGKDT
jgi:hypothetical protein